MQVGDLVKHSHIERVGVILETPEETGNGDYLVMFASDVIKGNIYCAGRMLSLAETKNECPNAPCHCGACDEPIEDWQIDDAINGRR